MQRPHSVDFLLDLLQRVLGALDLLLVEDFDRDLLPKLILAHCTARNRGQNSSEQRKVARRQLWLKCNKQGDIAHVSLWHTCPRHCTRDTQRFE